MVLEKLLLIPRLIYIFLAAAILLILAAFVPVIGNYILGIGFVIAGVLLADVPFYESTKGKSKFSFTLGTLFGTVGIIIIGFNFLNINVFSYFGSVISLVPAEAGSVVATTIGVQDKAPLDIVQILIATGIFYVALDIFGVIKRKAK